MDPEPTDTALDDSKLEDATPAAHMRSAAALVIGNELLTGKIADTNAAVLARTLFELGISLRRIVVCPDEVETIAADLESLCGQHDYVFTSGGVGPTHDDVTVEAVGRALGRPLVHSAELEALLTTIYGPLSNPQVQAMAYLPEGVELMAVPGIPWPTVRVANVFVLPGMPEVFERQLPALRAILEGGAPFVSRAVGTRCREDELADLLGQLSARHGAVTIGSYPRAKGQRVRVLVTFDGRDSKQVDRAVGDLLEALPADRIVELRDTNFEPTVAHRAGTAP